MIHEVHEFERTVTSERGVEYVARAYAGERDDANWDGWLVFFPVGGGRALPTDRETTQPAIGMVEYWSTGLGAVYLEGALRRAIALTPEARLARRVGALAREEATKKAEADAYERAADRARRSAEEVARAREEAERSLRR